MCQLLFLLTENFRNELAFITLGIEKYNNNFKSCLFFKPNKPKL